MSFILSRSMTLPLPKLSWPRAAALALGLHAGLAALLTRVGGVPITPPLPAPVLQARLLTLAPSAPTLPAARPSPPTEPEAAPSMPPARPTASPQQAARPARPAPARPGPPPESPVAESARPPAATFQASAAPEAAPPTVAAAAADTPATIPATASLTPGTQPPATGAAEAPSLQLPSFDAAYLDNPPPDYPLAARRLGLQGAVTLRVLVSPAGLPAEIKLAQSSQSPLLDDAALRAVRRWRFVPGRRGDTPVAAWVEVPIRFRLNDA
ncbi:MAG: TonB family protein [Pseudomonadota bacterium]